ncbi:NCAM-related cell adhesion molecule precursor [Aplysia californica]|uniref:NCAM-related cell adhesion molecule n=1 Tax=Aplysia californica TaxID=6500 RepID=Q9BKP9_APLCA|nr:NCAM-related cell adhesion molecule precursor [Aplysia californica]AAK14901.1 NCAM-related cell adhesion molecule [Aplysia californica]
MDFAYIIFVALLVLPICAGQEDDVTPFEVMIRPPLEEDYLDLGESKTYTCGASATSDQVTLKWFINDQEITATSGRVRVEALGNSRYMLRIGSGEDNDGGVYRCEGTLAGQTDSKTINVVVIKPLEIHSDQEQFDILGGEGEVECEVSGKPAPTVTWKFENNTKIEAGEKYTIALNKLIIKDLSLEDTKKYLCDIIVIDTGETKDFYIDFTVVKLPTIALPPTIHPDNPKVGDEVKITCQATGVPPPTYQFKKGDVMVTDEMVNNGVLTINPLKTTDQATYTCIATNKGGFAESSNTLDVKVPPTIEDMEETYDAVSGQELTITCTAKGDPEPSVIWKKDGPQSASTDGIVNKGPTYEKVGSNQNDMEEKTVAQHMTFKPVTYQDAGTYICTAFSLVGSANKTVKLTVQYKPNFDTDFKEREFFGWRGHKANLTCQANANPVATIEWYMPDAENPDDYSKAVRIPNEAPYTINMLQKWDGSFLSSRSLHVDIGDETSHYKDFLCEATNVQGTTWQVVTLKEAKPPGSPVISMGNVLTSSITVNIEPPAENNGQPVTEYTYLYYPDGDAAQTNNGQTARTGDKTKLELTGLTSNTPYVVKVKAKNNVGEGEEATVTIPTLKVSKPFRLTIKSPQMSENADSYLLEWEQPDDGGSPIKHFSISYRQVKVKGTDEPGTWKIDGDIDLDPKLKVVPNPSALSTRLDDLDANAFYEIRLWATNEEGDSELTQVLIKTSAGAEGEEEKGEEKVAQGSGKEEGDNEKIEAGQGPNANGSTSAVSEDGAGSSSAGLGSGGVIGIIVTLIVILLIVVLIIYFVTKKKPELVDRLRGRLGGKGGEEERGAKDDGKDPAEEEKLIKEDSVKVENEVEENKPDQVIEEQPEEFEPETKPETPAEPPATGPAEADAKPEDLPAPAPTTEIKITPETPEKPENPPA